MNECTCGCGSLNGESSKEEKVENLKNSTDEPGTDNATIVENIEKQSTVKQ